jgi:hypothetical protein
MRFILASSMKAGFACQTAQTHPLSCTCATHVMRADVPAAQTIHLRRNSANKSAEVSIDCMCCVSKRLQLHSTCNPSDLGHEAEAEPERPGRAAPQAGTPGLLSQVGRYTARATWRARFAVILITHLPPAREGDGFIRLEVPLGQVRSHCRCCRPCCGCPGLLRSANR